MFHKLLCSNSYLMFPKCVSTYATHAPLSGIKVLDMTRIISGPVCTMALADFGADVYKIEHPTTGDDTRTWPPIFPDSDLSCAYVALNRNKKSICVNFKTEEGQELMRDMVKKCDVLVENYVPGTLKKYGLDYESVKEISPSLIYCTISGFGSEGPYANKACVDLIAASYSGLLHLTGPENGEPCRAGTSSIDIMTGLRAHGAILAALYDRIRTGKGCKIDCDLFSSAVAALKNYAIANLNMNIEPKRMGTEHQSVVPYKTYKSKDGFITVGAINDRQFVKLSELLGKSELSSDERYKTAAKRAKNRKELVALLSPIFLTKTTKEWCNILATTSLPYAPLNTITQASNTPPTLRLRCRKPKSEKSVRWNEGTIDNEHMNKKKSKCCCIYKKPKQKFDESSESESDECDNCFGHVEVKKAKQLAKASCSEQSSVNTSNDVPIDHSQQINPSGIAAVSS